MRAGRVGRAFSKRARGAGFVSLASLGVLAVGVSIGSTIAHAADKSGYSIFTPTPAEEMREFFPDRPNRTEGPFTVDAGHLQLESDLLTYTRNTSSDGVLKRDFTYLAPNLKLGLTDKLDFEAIATLYQTSLSKAGGLTERHSGFGDVVLRAKWNFLGNDGGVVAVGLLPFAKFPTAAEGLGNDRLEGGVILPVQLTLPHDYGLALMAELDRDLNADGGAYHTEWVTSIALGHPIAGKLEGYVEIYNVATSEVGAPGYATFDAGLIYHLSGSLMIDAGANLGLTPSADAFNPFLGFSYRR